MTQPTQHSIYDIQEAFRLCNRVGTLRSELSGDTPEQIHAAVNTVFDAITELAALRVQVVSLEKENHQLAQALIAQNNLNSR